MNSRNVAIFVLGITALLTACAGPQSGANGTGAPVPTAAPPQQAASRRTHVDGARFRYGYSPIQHVVIIVQENRSVDNLFNALPGANTVQSGTNSSGQTVTLAAEPLTAPYDLSHRHSAWIADYNGGEMNGFNNGASSCRQARECPARGARPYAFVPQSDVQPYYTMAEAYTFADDMFQSNQGPSFPAHQYLLSGTSTISDGSALRAAENPVDREGKPSGGCDSPAGSKVELIDAYGNENQTTYPCFERNSIIEELDNAGYSWRYYQENPGAGLWNGVDALEPIWNTRYFENVVTPSKQVLNDIAWGRLANVTWITPSAQASDHAGVTDGSGPSWVASIVNAIGDSRYWSSTAIFVTWDDWGGWYDHVQPPVYNSYELGLRVPLIVISPYAKTGYVSHDQHEFGSILKFTEETFGLASLGTTDERADDLSDCFDFGGSGSTRKFVKIKAPLGAKHFLDQPVSKVVPDSDE